MALRHSRCPHLAEDAAQEAVVRAWRAGQREPEVRDRRAWLAAIARREVLRLLARQRDRQEASMDTVERGGAMDETLQRVVDRASMGAALAQLSRREQELLRLRYVEDLTQPQVAERLRMPEGTVKVQLHRARTRLRPLLQDGR